MKVLWLDYNDSDDEKSATEISQTDASVKKKNFRAVS